MTVTGDTSKEGEEVIVRGQGWYMRLRALGTCAHILARLAIPAILTAYNVWLRSQRLILQQISTHISYAIASISLTMRFQAIGVFLLETKSKLKPLLWADPGATLGDPDEERDIFCEVLYDPGPATMADVIFIHGLKGSLYKTWKQGLWDTTNTSDIRWTRLNSTNNNEEEFESNQDPADPAASSYEPEDSTPGEYSKCWPRDWLPVDCPGVRIIAVNYSTDPFLWKPFWIHTQQRLPMKERGREMMNLLLKLGVGTHPIVWVGHSKGGLFVKQMLVHAFESESPTDVALCSKSKAILFYSVPHRGSPVASIDFPLLTRSIELREVMTDSLEVQYLQEKFQHLLNSNLLQVRIKSFIETKHTLMKILYFRIVSVESADLGIGELYGVPLDHKDICKPKSRHCFLYRELVRLVQSVVQQGPLTRHAPLPDPSRTEIQQGAFTRQTTPSFTNSATISTEIQEGAFTRQTTPSFTNSATTSAEIQQGAFTRQTTPSFTNSATISTEIQEGAFTRQTTPSFTNSATTSTEIQQGAFTRHATLLPPIHSTGTEMQGAFTQALHPSPTTDSTEIRSHHHHDVTITYDTVTIEEVAIL